MTRTVFNIFNAQDIVKVFRHHSKYEETTHLFTRK